MQKANQSTDKDSVKHAVGERTVVTSSEGVGRDELRAQLERSSRELENYRQKLSQTEQALSKVRGELVHLQRNDRLKAKEVVLDQLTADMHRAQEMATMGSWSLDLASREVFWTPELYKMFGQDPSRPVPNMEEQRFYYTEASYQKMLDMVSNTIENGSPYNIELDIIRRDGTTGIVRSIGEAECDETGRIVRLRGMAQDISDIKATESRLKLALEEEKATQMYKDQFLANMSHEIRTPLNGVVGFASLLREEDLDSETRNEYINTIESCSNQLLDLINDILDIAKIKAGQMEIHPQLIQLADFTREIAATHEAIKGDQGKGHIRLVTRIAENCENLQIHSDPLRIRQILTNLLSNAFKFTDQGSIHFGFERVGEQVEFF